MPLTVLNIAFPLAPTSPDSVGGAEQVLADLDRALVAHGHTSLVVAAEGSETAGRLWPVPVPKREVLTDDDKRFVRAQVQASIDRALAAQQVDLVHMHGIDFADYKLPADIPVLVTLHLPLAWYPRGIWETCGPNVHFCCVSHSQRNRAPARLRDCAVVENGVPLPPFSPDTPRENYALVMGRICPEKNQHAALEAGTRAGLPVYLAGHVFPYREHRDYFDHKIQPLLLAPSPGHRFLGPLSSGRKQHLLAHARCLLHPTLAPETSSLVAMEALAAGTPVIAYRSGALPGIVDDGHTGFLVDSLDQMADAIAGLDRISHAACRAAAEQRFCRDRMVHGYFELYRTLADPVRESACQSVG
jgi:glycosyltransferase involved in cell wall biosynthesis